MQVRLAHGSVLSRIQEHEIGIASNLDRALRRQAEEAGRVAEIEHDTRLIDRRDLQEVEAESVAYLLCATVGVDSAQYSVPYLATWSHGDTQLLHDTAERTLTTTANLIAVLETELSVDLTPDPLTAARRPDAIELVAPTGHQRATRPSVGS